MSIRKISYKVFKKVTLNVGRFPTWEEFAKAELEDKIKKGKTCIENE